MSQVSESQELRDLMQECLDNILAMPETFYQESQEWWNRMAHPALRKMIVAASYYEHLATSVEEDVEELLVEDGI